MSDQDIFRRRHLPHWDVPGGTYFVTSCLAGSIPACGLLDLTSYRKELEARPRPSDVSPEDWEMRLAKLEFARLDRWLDDEPAVRHLADPRLAAKVRDSLYHFAGERYDLLGYVVMPSHIHWVFRPRDEWVAVANLGHRSAREAICHSVKRHSGLVCNEALGLHGQFWQDESYDHWVRDLDELIRCIAYTENNPVKAGMRKRPEEWEFSSAFDRVVSGIRFGEPLKPRRTG